VPLLELSRPGRRSSSALRAAGLAITASRSARATVRPETCLANVSRSSILSGTGDRSAVSAALHLRLQPSWSTNLWDRQRRLSGKITMDAPPAWREPEQLLNINVIEWNLLEQKMDLMSISEQTLISIKEKFPGQHDCAPKSLLLAMPEVDSEKVREGLTLCTENWPYGGVTNKEFAIAIKFLGLKHEYHGDEESLENLLSRKPARCVALLWRHFIAIRDGAVAGRELLLKPIARTKVICSWVFD